MSDERKLAMREAAYARMGHPPGFARVYGSFVPAARAKEVRRAAQEAIRRTGNRLAGVATAAALAKRAATVDVEHQGKVSAAYRCQDTTLPVVFRG